MEFVIRPVKCRAGIITRTTWSIAVKRNARAIEARVRDDGSRGATKERCNLPWCCKWKASFSRRCSIYRRWPVPAGRIPSRNISGRRRRFCCKDPRDPNRSIRREPRPVECPCPRISYVCTTGFRGSHARARTSTHVTANSLYIILCPAG